MLLLFCIGIDTLKAALSPGGTRSVRGICSSYAPSMSISSFSESSASIGLLIGMIPRCECGVDSISSDIVFFSPEFC